MHAGMLARRLVWNHPIEHYRRRDQQRQNGHHNKQTGIVVQYALTKPR